MIGAQLDVVGGRVGDGLEALDASINVAEGIVGDNARLTQGSDFSIRGGSVGDYFEMDSEGTLAIDGGAIGDRMSASRIDTFSMSSGMIGNDATIREANSIDVSGGSIGRYLRIFGSKIHLRGGSVGDFFEVRSGSQLTLSGGTVGREFGAYPGSTVNIRGAEFSLDGVMVDLESRSSVQINDRNVLLEGLLADGTPFAFDLSDNSRIGESYFASDATLTLTLVPEPSSLLLILLAVFGPMHRRAPGAHTP